MPRIQQTTYHLPTPEGSPQRIDVALRRSRLQHRPKDVLITVPDHPDPQGRPRAMAMASTLTYVFTNQVAVMATLKRHHHASEVRLSGRGGIGQHALHELVPEIMAMMQSSWSAPPPVQATASVAPPGPPAPTPPGGAPLGSTATGTATTAATPGTRTMATRLDLPAAEVSDAPREPAVATNLAAAPICPIGLGPIEVPIRTPCGHLFERANLEVWAQQHNTCPCCRHAFELAACTTEPSSTTADAPDAADAPTPGPSAAFVRSVMVPYVCARIWPRGSDPQPALWGRSAGTYRIYQGPTADSLVLAFSTGREMRSFDVMEVGFRVLTDGRLARLDGTPMGGLGALLTRLARDHAIRSWRELS